MIVKNCQRRYFFKIMKLMNFEIYSQILSAFFGRRSLKSEELQNNYFSYIIK